MTGDEQNYVRSRRRQQAKRRRYLHAIGQPPKIDAAPVIRHAQFLHNEHGMSIRAIAKAAGVSNSAAHRAVSGRHRDGSPVVTMYREQGEALLAAQPVALPEDPNAVALLDITGSRRRAQALMALGFSGTYLSEMLGYNQLTNLWRLLLPTGYKSIGAHRVFMIREAYDKYQHADPVDFGLSAYSINRAKNVAQKHNMAPPSCWDDDTIDDPDAAPEWTGACGTSEGYRIHLREGIPVCDACRDTYRVEQERTFSYEKFARAFIASGLSGQELAQITGASTTAVYRWTRGERNPLPSSVNAIAQALGVGVEDITDEGDVVTISPVATGEFNRHTLAVAIEQRGWNKNALGKAAGLSHTAISKWTTGAALPHKTSIQKVAEILGIDWKEFYR